MRMLFATACRTTLFTLLITGVAYPFFTTAMAQLVFPHAANGSMVQDEHGITVGSTLIGQPFPHAGYFQPRPSAAGAGYDPMASGGSNQGVTSAALRQRAVQDVERLRRENPSAELPVPEDLVAASGSGLDPEVSPAAALWQVPRVAEARHVSADRVRATVQAHIQQPEFGLLGEPRVNVLMLNLAMDRQFGRPGKSVTKAPERP